MISALSLNGGQPKEEKQRHGRKGGIWDKGRNPEMQSIELTSFRMKRRNRGKRKNQFPALELKRQPKWTDIHVARGITRA